ncbi:protein-L-isoaspartate O-methyltransferase-domain-containing protein [Catenaria anguillulae PL171]|uniref:protein-L-isoaspartate(D-aspartate) O-methyltransferase n=1 Tax=Catenaria anguillulae PL171 TaxID=765915 RepID=A0A1Y2HET7_9FUNG|nr:protein-L-isoaspartate O-methyltransferase-domain-containing protein [Catenaria anguillulae PL171]
MIVPQSALVSCQSTSYRHPRLFAFPVTPCRNCRCHHHGLALWPRTNTGLVDNLFGAGIIKSQRVKDAMLAVDRNTFVPGLPASLAYADSPQSIGFGATISAPHMHAYALEHLEPYLKPGSHVLDGVVVAIDHIPELVQMAHGHLTTWDAESLTSGRIICITGDGRKGFPTQAPYSAIHVGAAAPKIPQELIDQLASPGRMFIPVGPDGGEQYLMQVDKDADGQVTKTKVMGVRYVPLTDRERQVGSA